MSGRDQPLALVAGIGNPDRGDDGVGPAVARRLRGRAPSDVGILERSGDTLGLIEEWNGFSSVFIIDAVTLITKPGQVHRFDLARALLPVTHAPRSTHAFGLAETVELARSLGRLPLFIVGYLVEGTQFNSGAPLSPAVAHAVEEVADQIAAELTGISATAEE